MKLSIIIVNYNHKDFLKECLRNIQGAILPPDHEIIIVDNNSTDGSREAIFNFSRSQSDRGSSMPTESSILDKVGTKSGQFSIFNFITILNKKNLGYAAGNNQAIKSARGEYILILNPDIFVKKDSIVKLINFMENHPKIVLSGPKLISPDGQLQYSCLRFPKWYIPILRRTFLGNLKIFEKKLYSYLMVDFDHKEPREVDWLMGAALMVKKKAIEKVGLMDERFFLYFEDVDWCRRFKEEGFKVYYYPDSEMVHFHQRLSFVRGPMVIFNRITWIHIFSWLKYLIKYRYK